MSIQKSDRNFRYLGLGLIGLGVLTVASILLYVWTDAMEGKLLWDILLTVATLGGFIGFLVMVGFDAANTRYPIGLKVLAVFAGALTLTVLAQVWFDAFEAVAFSKILLTEILLVGLISLIIIVKEDILQSKRLKDDNYLD